MESTKVVLIYRTQTDGLKVGLFTTEEQAEEQAIKWVAEDFPDHQVQTLDGIRDLEEAHSFAIDICFLHLGETWEND